MQYLPFVPFLIIFVGVGLSYIGLLPAMLGWIVSALGVLVGLGIAIAFSFTGNLWGFVLVDVAPIAIAIPMVINDLRYPRINDVTTNTEHPPEFLAALHASPNIGRDMTFPEGNASIVRGAYANVQPLLLDEPLQKVFQRLENVAKHQDGWVITHHDANTRTLEAEVATSCFRFIDDVVITVSDQNGKARVDMRSKSRDGLIDAGANAKRIHLFFEQVKKQTSAQPPGEQSMAEQIAILEDARQQMAMLPRPVQYWMWWMNIVFLIGFAFVFSHEAARWVLAAYVVCFPVAIPIYYSTRNIDMLGVPHVLFWTPLLIYLPLLVAGDPNFNLLSPFGIWTIFLFLTISISVVFDVRAIIAFFSRN